MRFEAVLAQWEHHEMSRAEAARVLGVSDSGSPLHDRERCFLETCVAGSEIVYLAWPTVMAYLRIATDGAIFEKPLSPQQAMQNIEGFARPVAGSHTLGESDGFWGRGPRGFLSWLTRWPNGL